MKHMPLQASRVIAQFSVGLSVQRLSEANLQMCGRAIADTVAVAVAGWKEPAALCALAYAKNMDGATTGRLWGRSECIGLEGAALCNGIAAHALDYDDASSPMSGHPSVVLLPALLALADARGMHGTQIALGYAAGFEVACALGRALSATHYQRGWHLTSTIGTIASAVACSRLLDLGEEETCNAVGLAVAQASGSRISFRTDAKLLQAGNAAAAGLRAALLAENGFTAAADAIDGDAGFTALYSEGELLAESLLGMGERSLEMDLSGVEIKKYAACYNLHRPIDGLLELKQEHDLTLSNVVEIEVQTSQGSLAPLISHAPRNGTEGRFSMSYALAAALHDGNLKLSTFTDAAVMRPELRPLMERVTMSEAFGRMTPRWAYLQVALANGRRLEKRVDILRGSPEQPLTDKELTAKVADCLSWGSSALEPKALMASALAFHQNTARHLIDEVTNGLMA